MVMTTERYSKCAQRSHLASPHAPKLTIGVDISDFSFIPTENSTLFTISNFTLISKYIIEGVDFLWILRESLFSHRLSCSRTQDWCLMDPRLQGYANILLQMRCKKGRNEVIFEYFWEKNPNFRRKTRFSLLLLIDLEVHENVFYKGALSIVCL